MLVKRSGLSAHLQNRDDPRCKEYLKKLRFCELPEDDSEDDVQQKSLAPGTNTDEEEEEPPILDSKGDFYGDYADFGPQDFIDDGPGSDDGDEDGEEDGQIEGADDVDESGIDEDAANAEQEFGLEPPRVQEDDSTENEGDMMDGNDDEQLRREDMEEATHRRPFVVKFGGMAGAVVSDAPLGSRGNEEYAHLMQDPNNIYAPFSTKLEWEIARWAKLRGPSSTAFTELMSIEGVSI